MRLLHNNDDEEWESTRHCSVGWAAARKERKKSTRLPVPVREDITFPHSYYIKCIIIYLFLKTKIYEPRGDGTLKYISSLIVQ